MGHGKLRLLLNNPGQQFFDLRCPILWSAKYVVLEVIGSTELIATNLRILFIYYSFYFNFLIFFFSFYNIKNLLSYRRINMAVNFRETTEHFFI